MSTWVSIGPAVCIAVTAVGLVLSVLVWRKRGPRSGLRGIAWSLLPLAAWLTHAVRLLGQLISAIVQFASSFVFNPMAWLGVILIGCAVLLFLISGGMPLVRGRKRHDKERKDKQQPGGTGGKQVAVPARDHAAVSAGDEHDDLADVRDILRRHGIS